MPRPALAQEQAHLDTMYERLDQVRDRVRRRLDGVLLQPAGTRQAASERDAAADGYADQLARYEAAEADLCFGRLDLDDGEFLHVGRIGLFDVAEDDRPLLVDWRAPAARPFYVATAVTRHGVVRRRYIRTRRRTVTGIDDDVLDSRLLAPGDGDGPNAAGEGTGGASELADGLAGEAALLSALDAPRTGRMRDIVATIQAEQDHAIRSDLSGVVVVQGGPGTGKTAVALHRAAYLLFTHRELLARRGVLVLGPNATFLRYISQVLPSLAETGVVSWTVGQLFPGVDARAPEPDEAAAVKGHLDMAEVIAAAVRDRQQVPDDVLEVLVDDERLELDRATCEQARDRARAASGLHNDGRPVFLAEITTVLARQLALRIGYDPYGFDPLGEDDAPESDTVFDDADVADLARDLERNPAVVAVVDRLWPSLTPQRLLADLWADPARIAAAAPHLTERERHLLRRTVTDPAHDWTPSDVPLLDEAAELLGDVGTAGRAGGPGRGGADRERRDRIEYAQGVLDVAAGSRSIDLDAGEGILQAADLLDARSLAERHATTDRRSAAERAADDRRWTFGHVIVDEAQDVSPMAWRALMRRCPTRSMTLAGDLAQAGAPGSTTTWQQVLGPYVGDRWRLEELTLSYRTPAEIFALAAGVLTRVNPALRPPRAVRTGGARPWALRVPPNELVVALADAVRREIAAVTGDGDHGGVAGDEGRAELGARFAGSVGVIVPAGAVDELGPHLARAVPGLSVGDDPDLEAPAVLLTPRRAKGLEFDAVIVVEPQRILAGSVRGASDLYVTLTRATKRLGLVHSEPLPEDLDPSSFDRVGD